MVRPRGISGLVDQSTRTMSMSDDLYPSPCLEKSLFRLGTASGNAEAPPLGVPTRADTWRKNTAFKVATYSSGGSNIF